MTNIDDLDVKTLHIYSLVLVCEVLIHFGDIHK